MQKLSKELQTFDEGLKLSDAALKSMSLEAYKNWIKTMMAGVVALASQCNRNRAASLRIEHASRAAKSFNRRNADIQKWREESETLLDTKTFSRLKASARLRTKGNFTYLANLLRNKDWYLVSLLWTKRYREGTWLTKTYSSLVRRRFLVRKSSKAD